MPMQGIAPGRILWMHDYSNKLRDMKKLLSLLVTLCLAVPALQAQGRHEINLSIGAVSGEFTRLDVGNYSYNDLYGLYEPHYTVNDGPVLTLDYHFKVNSVVHLGAEFDYSNLSGYTWYNIGGQQRRQFRTDVFSIMPQVKLRIPGAAHFRLYGKAAAGVQIIDSDLAERKNASPVRFAWDITPIGFEWGGNFVYGMFETCVGNVIIGARIGVGFRF